MLSKGPRNILPLLGFALALTALIVAIGVSLYNLELLVRTADDVAQADEARQQLDEFTDGLTDAESGQRGFLLTGDPGYLEPYYTGVRRVATVEPALIDALEDLDIDVEAELAAFLDAAHRKQAELASTLDTFEEKGGKAALAMVVTDEGLRLGQVVRGHERQLRHRIAARATELRLRSAEGREFARLSTLASGSISVLVLALAFFLAERQQMLRRLAQARTEHYSRQLAELAEVARRLNRARDRESLMGMASTELRRLLGVDVAAIVVHDPEPASAVTVGTRASALSSWRPHEAPLGIGVRAEGQQGFTATGPRQDAPVVFQHPEELEEAMAMALRTPQGRVFGHIVAAEPVGEHLDAVAQIALVQMSQSLGTAWENVRLLEQLQDTAQQREAFISMLGHELRNPLNAVAGAAQILSRRIEEPDPLAEVVSMLHRQSALMRKLVDELLDAARLERGTIQLERRPVDLPDLVRKVVDDFRTGRAIPGGLTCELPSAGIQVNGDPSRIAQCVTNLLDNALKFSQDEPIQVEVVQVGEQARVIVTDHGVGIPANELGRIFERYAQVEGRRRSEGLGLGLALVHGLAELHGGSVRVHSEGPGKGSRFVLELPVSHTTPAHTPMPGPEVRPRKVLVVDDREDARLALSTLLEEDGHDVVVACNGTQAIDLAKTPGISVVICDISMGDGPDGHEVARTLRARPELAGLKLIALTGFGTHRAREMSREAGFDHHLTKPVSLEEIRRILLAFDAEQR